uniref:Protein lifeguard 1 n=1 Tax=Strigamia maritima TaxID=126957 RepID=T1JKG3_STRMM
MYNDSYEEPLMASNFEFSEKSVRMAFIRKVYAILMVQLAITLAVSSLLIFEPNCRAYSHEHPEMSYIAIAMTFICIISLACCTNVRRQTPTNFIVLGIFTFCEAFLVGSVASFYKADAVAISLGICVIVCLGLTIFAFQTKYDFTMCGGMLFVALLIFVLFGFFSLFFMSRVLEIVYASIGALIFSMYLVFDTQMMIGGNHKYSLSPEEYVFAALNLYLDIINLFLYILTLVSSARK